MIKNIWKEVKNIAIFCRIHISRQASSKGTKIGHIWNEILETKENQYSILSDYSEIHINSVWNMRSVNLKYLLSAFKALLWGHHKRPYLIIGFVFESLDLYQGLATHSSSLWRESWDALNSHQKLLKYGYNYHSKLPNNCLVIISKNREFYVDGKVSWIFKNVFLLLPY